jgi:hypothetical protein
LTEAAGTPWGRSVLRNDPRFQEVFDSLADAEADRAVRIQAIRGIEQLHTLSGLMNRTLRRDIGEFTQRKPQTVTVEFTPEQKNLHDAVIAAQAAVYAALHGDQSVRFLLTTIRRQAASCIQALAPFLKDILSRRFDELDCLSVEDGEDEGIDFDVDRTAPTVRKLIDDALRQAEALPCDPNGDPKFLALKRVLEGKQSLSNNKVMLFSSFRHTLAYLHKALLKAGFRVGLIHGGVSDDDRVALRARFEKHRDDAEALDVLLFSEVGCEGLDYQFCDCMVNYDLPWNPLRIDQRIGRIDRWGQTSEAVAIYNLITPDTIDAEIYERCLLRIGVFERALGANEAILGEVTREITSVAENLSLSPAERQAKLEQLADNGIRLVKEQQDLEARQTELFGLRMPADQFKQDIEDASSYWLSAPLLERLVAEYLSDRSGKEDSLLTGEGAKKRLRLAREAREAAGLEAALAGMDEAARAGVMAQARELARLQEAPDSPEALATIPRLDLADIPREEKPIPARAGATAAAMTRLHDIPARGIVYLDAGLDLTCVPQRLLPLVPLFGRALFEMGTAREDFAELSMRIARKTGGMGSEIFTSTALEAAAPVARLFLHGKATAANAPEMLDILRDVLLTARFDDRERFRLMVSEEKARMEQSLVPSGHMVVLSRLRARASLAGWAAERMGGLEALQAVRALAGEVESDWPGVLARLEELRGLLARSGGMVLNVTGDAADLAALEGQLADFAAALPAGAAPAAAWTPGPLPAREGLTIPARVNYVGKIVDLTDAGWAFNGADLAAVKYARMGYLWEKVRVRGGAYGAFCVLDRFAGSLAFTSYRDPALAGTLAAFDGAGAFFKALELSPTRGKGRHRRRWET